MELRRRSVPTRLVYLIGTGVLALLLSCGALIATPGASLAAEAVTNQQCANQPDGLGPCDWVKGNVNEAKAQYFEGDSVPYRVVMEKLEPSTQYWITFGWDTTKSAKHALDYITTYDWSESFADPCSGWTGGVGPVTCSTVSTFPIPTDPQVTAAGVTQVPGDITLWNGTIDSVGSNAPDYDDGLYTYWGDYTGTSSALITVKFTTGPGQTAVVLAYGGHIGTEADWGVGGSAVGITGSPYHAFLNGASWGSTGSQDLQLSASAVIVPGSITIVKEANPEGATEFPFRLTRPDLTTADFTLVDDGTPSNTTSFIDLSDFGVYSVEEFVPTGWSLDSIVCDDGSPQTPPTASIDLAEGEDVTCTFYDTRQPAYLTLVKTVVNDDGGTAVAADFQAYIDGSPVDWNVAYEVEPNVQHTASEDVVLGYSASVWGTDCAADGTVTVLPGDNKTCTITNDDIGPTLTLVKTVVNDDGGTAVAADFQAYIDAGAVNWNTTYDVSAGPHTASEDVVPGYSASAWSGDCASDGSITLALDEDAICYITNDDIAPTLTLVKTVVNDDGGTAVAADFQAYIDAGAVNWSTTYDVSAGPHTASEDVVPGYSASAWTGDCASDGSITLALDEDAICYITNDDIAPTLTLVKTVVNDDGGTAVAADFQAYIDGGPVDWSTAYDLSAGSYTASEDVVSGYSASVWSGDCASDGSVTLGLDEDAICYITNDDIGPTLTLVKTVVNDDGGTAVAADFQAYIDAGAVNWSTTYDVSAGPHTASEDVVPGYSASAWTGDCASDGSITLALDEDATCYITNNDIGPTLTLVKTVINNDGGTAVAADFQAYIDAGAVNWSTTYDVSAGPHTASEDVVPGYSASAWTGDCASDGSITLALDEDATCYITNDDLPICLEIEKTGEECAHPGEEITYHFWVHNCGEVTLNGAKVTDPLWDPDLDFPLGSLLPDEEAEFDRSYMVPSVFSGDVMPNTAMVQGTDVLGRVVNDSDGHVVEILHPCIDVTKSHLPSGRAGGVFFPGDKITYVFKVTNCSADTPLYNVQVVDEWVTPYSGQRFSKNLGSIGAGSNKGFSWVYTVPDDAEEGLSLVNEVTAFGVDDCEGTVDDTARDPVVIGQPRIFVPEWDSILLLASGLGPLAAYASMRFRKRR